MSDFGDAITHLKSGGRAYRKAWNSKSIFIKLQIPDANSKMTSPYIYIDTTGLNNNVEGEKSLVPWLTSQTDILAEDYILVD